MKLALFCFYGGKLVDFCSCESYIRISLKPKSKKLHEQKCFKFVCTVSSAKWVLKEKSFLKIKIILLIISLAKLMRL